MSQQMTFKTLSLAVTVANFAVTVTGVNWSEMSDAQYDELHELTAQYPVVVIRGSEPVDAAMVEFCKRRGTIHTQPLQEKEGLNGWHGEHPEIYKITGSYHNEKGNDALLPHTDRYYVKDEDVPTHILLWAVTLPPNGPATTIHDSYRLHRELPPKFSDALTGKELITQTAISNGGRSFYGLSERLTDDTISVFRRPVLQQDIYGRSHVYLGAKTRGQFLYPMEDTEGGEILDYLWQKVTSEDFTYKHIWQEKDVLLTFNCLHGREPYVAFEDGEKATRVMHRINFIEKDSSE